MALNKEDYNDIKQAKGKAMANKISDVTRDRKVTAYGDTKGDTKMADMLRAKIGRAKAEKHKIALRLRIKSIME